MRRQSKEIQMQGTQILRSEAYVEPHSQAYRTACYAHTGDILSKEHLPTAKPVVLCAEGERYAAVTKDEEERSPSALLKAMSPSTLPRTVSLSNGLSNGRWIFYEAEGFDQGRFA